MSAHVTRCHRFAKFVLVVLVDKWHVMARGITWPRSIAERLGQVGPVGAAVPRSLGQRDRRVWVPLTKRVAQRIEQRYPIWLSFVRSHRAVAGDGLGLDAICTLESSSYMILSLYFDYVIVL